jgi:spore coat polysaccharide biosynthesis protein SpsF (cytidylyltransferase family)
MKTVAIIQARLGSSRLPGKVFLRLNGKPVLQWVVEAAKRAIGVDDVMVATPDIAITQWCAEHGVWCVRGSEHDVLARYRQAAVAANAHTIVRLTADCPFLDDRVISDVLMLRERQAADYATTQFYPDGLDVECFTANTLFRAATEDMSDYGREHVTTLMRIHDSFRRAYLACPLGDLSNCRWTLDTEEDFRFCEDIARGLGDMVPSYQAILHVLKRIKPQGQLRAVSGGSGGAGCYNPITGI